MEKTGGSAIIAGSLLLTLYAIGFPTLFPVAAGKFNLAEAVLSPYWIWLSLTALGGVLLMLVGFAAVYSRLRVEAGITGWIGYLLIQAAYLLQACKLSWEIFLYPVIASHSGSLFLLRDNVLRQDTQILIFKTVSGVTIFLGIVLFCLALYRSREYPKAAALLIFGGALTYALGPLLSIAAAITGIATLSVGCLLLGMTLIRRPSTVEA